MTTLLSSSRRLLVYCLLLATIAVANSENKTKKSKITKSSSKITKSSSKITKSSKEKKSHKRNGSDFIAFWYKPHYQCNGSDGSTPQNAANFINKQLLLTTPSDRPNKFAADFVGVSEWNSPDNILIGNPDEYGTIGGVCGYGTKDYSTPVALFYKKETWEITKSYPASSKCNLVPVPPWTGPQFGADVCFDKVKPSGDNCCSCVYSEEEYAQGNDIKSLGQRPWVGGIFQQKNNNEKKVCVITGEVPHPLMNMMIYNIDGKIETSNPLPYTIKPYLCTLLNTQDCVPNLSKSSILYGTDVLVSGVNEFCGDDTPIVFMFDTNVGMGYVTTGSLFNKLSNLYSLTSVSSLSPYTCCNDTATKGTTNPTYASDRISVSGNDLTIDKLQGGAVTSQGNLPGDMTFKCHCSEEHAPLRAHISFKKEEEDEEIDYLYFNDTW